MSLSGFIAAARRFGVSLIQRAGRPGVSLLDVIAPVFVIALFFFKFFKLGGEDTRGSKFSSAPTRHESVKPAALDLSSLLGSIWRLSGWLKPVYSPLSPRGLCNLVFDLALVLSLGICFYLILPMESERVLFIPKGSTKAIVTQLGERGYSLSTADAYLLRLAGSPQSGWIELPSSFIESRFDSKGEADLVLLTKARFLLALSKAKAATKTITLIPGETSYFLLRDLAKIFNKDLEKLEAIYKQNSPYEDGVVLANTYSLPYHASEDFIIKTLISQSLSRHKALAEELVGHYDEKQWFGVIAKASIIQKEAANIEEMPLVSSVIDNRLAAGIPLQMDGSLNYGLYSHMRVTPDRIRNDNSQFNTYKHKGIPKTPSGSVSIEAIKAALRPAKTDYLYFMRNKSGTHDFAKTYQEHLANINRAKN